MEGEVEILNKGELDSWLFEHAQVQGHICKRRTHGMNTVWTDENTGETVYVYYN